MTQEKYPLLRGIGSDWFHSEVDTSVYLHKGTHDLSWEGHGNPEESLYPSYDYDSDEVNHTYILDRTSCDPSGSILITTPHSLPSTFLSCDHLFKFIMDAVAKASQPGVSNPIADDEHGIAFVVLPNDVRIGMAPELWGSFVRTARSSGYDAVLDTFSMTAPVREFVETHCRHRLPTLSGTYSSSVPPTHPSKGSSMSNTLSVLHDDAQDAAWRTAGSQLVKTTRDPLVGLLLRHLGADQDDSLRLKLSLFLQTEVGTAVLATLLSMGLSALPSSMGTAPARLAKELRVKAMADVGDTVADLLMGPLRQVLTTYIQDPEFRVPSIPAQLPEPTAPFVVDSPIRSKAKVRKPAKKAQV